VNRPVEAIGAMLAVAFLFAVPAAAQSGLPAPAGEVILTVSGDITNMNQGDTAAFDLEILESLPSTTFTTTTIWTEGGQEFTGVELGDLLAAIGAEGGTLVAVAVNDYQIEIPVSDAVENGPIVAYLRNGEPMSVRDKGPLWVVYPFDDNADYRTEVIYSRSIWQLERIEVR